MSTDIVPFQFQGAQVRTLTVDGEPWFVARDVTTALGLSNGRDAIGRLDSDGVGIADIIDSLGRTQSAATVSEAGLYELIFQSRVHGAVEFKRWVTRTVLPAIRKTGSYGVAVPAELSRLEILTMAIDSERRAVNAEIEVVELTPRAEAYDRLAGSPTLIKIEVAARKAGIGRTTAFKLLRDNGIFSVYGNTPKSQHAHRFEEVPTTYQNRAGEDITTFTTKVHADSLVWLVSTLERFAADPAKEIA